MPRSKKSISETEELELEVKNLKSENRHLKKKIKEYQKREHLYQDFIEEVVPEESYKKKEFIEYCSSCGKGQMIYSDLKFVEYKVCNLCGDRKKL